MGSIGLVLFFVGIFLTFNCVAEETDCPLHLLTLFYKSLQCLPVNENEAKCPTSYDCTTFENRNIEVCNVEGRIYQPSEKIENTPPCQKNCFCDKSEGGYAVPNCTNTICPFPSFIACDYYRRADECCGISECKGDATKKNEPKETCTYDGNTRRLGEVFYVAGAAHKCKLCECQKGFRGIVEEPFCKHGKCNVQLQSTNELNKGCAPTYIEPVICCPYKWRCPEEDDTVIPSPTKDGPTNAVCKFGNLTLQHGDKLSDSSNYKYVHCHCDMPPFLSCQLEGKLF